MRLITFSLKVFSFAGIIGIFVLLPVNCTGELHIVDFTNLPNNSLDVFTISNIGNGSKRLWIHFSAVYVVTIFICYLLYYEYRYISSKRMAYFYSSKPQPHHFTILVHSIPVSVESSVSESVDRFFSEYHPSTYLSHIVIHRTNRLRSLINDAKQLYGRLTHLKSDDTQQKYHRSCCFGLCGRKVDLTDEYEKQLVDIEKNLRLEQSEVSSSGHKEARAAFVSFKSRLGAAIAFHLPQSSNPIEWVTEEAPEPDDVYWPFFSSSFMHRWISKLTVVVACITLTILFLVPVLIVQGLTNLSQLKTWFPFLESILTIKIVSQVITGYLPSLILQLFLKAVPPIMKFLSSIQGYISHSNIEKSACNKVLWFTIWNVFFATVFSGTAIYVVDIFLEPKQIPGKLAVAVPAQASFFIAYVVTTGWTSVCSELFRIIPFSFSLIKRPFTRSTDHELEVPSLPYHKDIPRILFFALLGITYFFLAPLILPFLLLYLCLGYIIYSNQFINVYAPRYESAGKFWPIVHDSIIFSLVLMHAIAVGIFTLKKLSLASSLICPLPIFTLLFNDYCRKRFLPIFVAYSAESLIKKDRQEENDPEMSEFYNKLVIAYQDPALMPVRFSSSSDGLNSPLISSAQV
ncbi:CSC1-like protein At1g69450 isoform X2 [Ziziphus jujuba]|nr:CSC1-like protein At1g69450 isoform X2 [Ziziphus jujuba]